MPIMAKCRTSWDWCDIRVTHVVLQSPLSKGNYLRETVLKYKQIMPKGLVQPLKQEALDYDFLQTSRKVPS